MIHVVKSWLSQIEGILFSIQILKIDQLLETDRFYRKRIFFTFVILKLLGFVLSKKYKNEILTHNVCISLEDRQN